MSCYCLCKPLVGGLVLLAANLVWVGAALVSRFGRVQAEAAGEL